MEARKGGILMLHTVYVEEIRPGFSTRPHKVFAAELRDRALRVAEERAKDPGVRVTVDPCGCRCSCSRWRVARAGQ
jgi:hypothetical protein